MGGNGLEPVTPACRFGAAFASVRWRSVERLVKRNLPASERLSERERTLILAILATRVLPLDGDEPGSSDVSALAQATVPYGSGGR